MVDTTKNRIYDILALYVSCFTVSSFGSELLSKKALWLPSEVIDTFCSFSRLSIYLNIYLIYNKIKV